MDYESLARLEWDDRYFSEAGGLQDAVYLKLIQQSALIPLRLKEVK